MTASHDSSHCFVQAMFLRNKIYTRKQASVIDTDGITVAYIRLGYPLPRPHPHVYSLPNPTLVHTFVIFALHLDYNLAFLLK